MTSSRSDSNSNTHSTAEKADSDDKSNQKNWYAKLHPIGITQHQDQSPKRALNLSIFFRIWLAVALVVIISGFAAFTQLFGYIKPTAQQVIEDTLLDTSKLLAASLQLPLQSGQLYENTYKQQLNSAFTGQSILDKGTEPKYRKKTYSSFRVYVTDSHGIVQYDSLLAPNNAEGQDYSRWNDVYLTLQGRYGARSSTDITSNSDSSIMYVAQPIKDDTDTLIGVVSVGKPVDSVLPYLNNTRNRMLITALLMGIAALILAGLVAWWLKQSISLVTQYTKSLAEDTKKPYFYLAHELNSLTDTIETMKHRLENRAYVTDYVHTLTHELKSPLTAIRASSELLEDNGLDDSDRHLLNRTIGEQSIKMQQLIDRLLLLAKVEQPTFKLNRQPIPLLPLLQRLAKDNAAKLQQQRLVPIKLYINDKPLTEIHIDAMQDTLAKITTVYADQFWLTQALQNVLDNAIYFAESLVNIHISSQEKTITIDTFNDGKPLPDYAVDKAFDRYFSLSHQKQSTQNANLQQHLPNRSTLKKGTGLGLTLVKQVIEHHSGSVSLQNIIADSYTKADVNSCQPAGVKVSIILPLAAIH